MPGPQVVQLLLIINTNIYVFSDGFPVRPRTQSVDGSCGNGRSGTRGTKSSLTHSSKKRYPLLITSFTLSSLPNGVVSGGVYLACAYFLGLLSLLNQCARVIVSVMSIATLPLGFDICIYCIDNLRRWSD